MNHVTMSTTRGRPLQVRCHVSDSEVQTPFEIVQRRWMRFSGTLSSLLAKYKQSPERSAFLSVARRSVLCIASPSIPVSHPQSPLLLLQCLLVHKVEAEREGHLYGYSKGFTVPFLQYMHCEAIEIDQRYPNSPFPQRSLQTGPVLLFC